MGREGPRIAWVRDEDARGPVSEVLEATRRLNSRRQVPHIFRTMIHAPDFMAGIFAAARFHFSDGR